MNPLQPGQIVKKVSVPYQVVGLVVGPKGSTIKRIQQNTNTYALGTMRILKGSALGNYFKGSHRKSPLITTKLTISSTAKTLNLT
jgi:hypothetical protein